MKGTTRRSSYNEANQPQNDEPGDLLFQLPKDLQKSKFIKLDGNFLATDGCDLLEMDPTDKTVRQFLQFRKLLKWSGFLFSDKTPQGKFTLQHLWLISLIIIGIYSCIFDFYFLAKEFDARHVPSIMVCSALVLQASLSLVFQLYWQRKLSFETFFHTLRHAKIHDVNIFDENYLRAYKRNRIRFWMVFTYSIINMFSFFLSIWLNHLQEIMHPSFVYTFYYPELRYLRALLGALFFNIVSINLHTYLCLTNALYYELKKFNYKIMQLRTVTGMEMKEKLEDLICRHQKISESIKAMDGIYQVYAFLVIACVIPLMILVLVLVFSRKTIIEFVFCIGPVFFCMYELYAIMYPAILHAELTKSKNLLCTNQNLWVPYDKTVARVAQILIMHLDQPELGISLWGFTRVTKPLILTTISAMMTCLAFLLDLRPKDEHFEKCVPVSLNENFTESLGLLSK